MNGAIKGNILITKEQREQLRYNEKPILLIIGDVELDFVLIQSSFKNKETSLEIDLRQVGKIGNHVVSSDILAEIELKGDVIIKQGRSERQIIEDKIKSLESLQWMVSSEAKYLGELRDELKEIEP